MLKITEDLFVLVDELNEAIQWSVDLLDELQEVILEEPADIVSRFGKFALNIPKFEILTKDSDSAIDIVRMLCTGEMSPEEAYEVLDQAIDELLFISEYLKNLIPDYLDKFDGCDSCDGCLGCEGCEGCELSEPCAGCEGCIEIDDSDEDEIDFDDLFYDKEED